MDGGDHNKEVVYKKVDGWAYKKNVDLKKVDGCEHREHKPQVTAAIYGGKRGCEQVTAASAAAMAPGEPETYQN